MKTMHAERRQSVPKLGKRRLQRPSLHCDDCFNVLPTIPAGSIDLILCDLPYGVTKCDWDKRVPLPELWSHYARVLKHDGAIVLTATQPFATVLAAASPIPLRYDIAWDKHFCTGFANAHRMPMRRHETVLVFYRRLPTYNAQGLRPIAAKKHQCRHSSVYGTVRQRPGFRQRFTGYPNSILSIPRTPGSAPCEKPIALMEYFVRTFTQPGQTVLDNCMGLGSTGVAAIRAGRNFIGMELDADRFATARERIIEQLRTNRRTQ